MNDIADSPPTLLDGDTVHGTEPEMDALADNCCITRDGGTFHDTSGETSLGQESLASTLSSDVVYSPYVPQRIELAAPAPSTLSRKRRGRGHSKAPSRERRSSGDSERLEPLIQRSSRGRGRGRGKGSRGRAKSNSAGRECGSIITVTRHDGVLVSQSHVVDDLESILSSSPPPSLPPVNDPYRFSTSGSINDTRETDPLTLEIEVLQLREMVEQQGARLVELEELVKALQEEVATLQYRSSTPLPSSALSSLLPPQGQSSSTDDVVSPTPVTPSSVTLQYRSSTPLPSSALSSLLPPQGQSSSMDDVVSPTPVTPSSQPQLATRGSSTDMTLPPIPVPTIDTSKLWTVQEVLTKHRRDINVCSAGRLC